MQKIIQKTEAGKTVYLFHCPACDRHHKINDRWDFDGNFEAPTIRPSILGTGTRPDKDGNWHEWRCHSYIKNGHIEYLGDCTHDMAGQTVELKPISE